MTTKTLKVYVGCWNGKEYVHALSDEQAREAVLDHFAFGASSEDGYTVGDTWASAEADNDWKIIEREIIATLIEVEIGKSDCDGISHVVWMCPYCKKPYSDDWLVGDCMPIVLICGCETGSKFLLGSATE